MIFKILDNGKVQVQLSGVEETHYWDINELERHKEKVEEAIKLANIQQQVYLEKQKEDIVKQIEAKETEISQLKQKLADLNKGVN